MATTTHKVGFAACFTGPGGKHFLAIPLPTELKTVLDESDRRRERSDECLRETPQQRVDRHTKLLLDAVQGDSKLLNAVEKAARSICPANYRLSSIATRNNQTVWRAPAPSDTELVTN